MCTMEGLKNCSFTGMKVCEQFRYGSFIKGNFNPLMLWCIKNVEAALGRTSSDLVNQKCTDHILKRDSSSTSTVASTCVGRKSVREHPFSLSHFLYVKKPMRCTACTGYVTRAVLFNDVALLSEIN